MLETIWFALWGILWAVYFVLDGFDFGIGVLAPFFVKNEDDRRAVYAAMGPYWNGNEVWLITAGGVTFAAFPSAYAVMFSSLYSPLLIILFGLIMRGVGMEFRGKFESAGWNRFWDWCVTAGNFVPALLFGVAFANLFMGIPIDRDGVYQGNLVTLLNVYGLSGGIFFLVMFMVHGSIWLALKSEGVLRERASDMAKGLWPVLAALLLVFLGETWVLTGLFRNYFTLPVLGVIPLLAAAALVTTRVYAGRAQWWRAWTSSSVFIVAVTLFGVAGMYPNLLLSSINRGYSMTAFNSASSPLTLKIMLGVALTFVPVVIAYQVWVYMLFARKPGPKAGKPSVAAAK
jgi:cytochrome bd ubiquinol oxidase subunit II